MNIYGYRYEPRIYLVRAEESGTAHRHTSTWKQADPQKRGGDRGKPVQPLATQAKPAAFPVDHNVRCVSCREHPFVRVNKRVCVYVYSLITVCVFCARR